MLALASTARAHVRAGRSAVQLRLWLRLHPAAAQGVMASQPRCRGRSASSAAAADGSATASDDGASGPARIAVAGAGWWAQGWHLPHLQRNPGSEIAAIVDPSKRLASTFNPDLEQVAALGERYGVPTFDTIDDMLADSSVQADGVVVASTHATHFDIGSKALGAGLHCLIEKPLTTDPAEARQLADLAASTGLLCSVNNTANWRPHTRTATEWIADGRIGKVRHVNSYMGSPLLWLFDDPANVAWVQPSGNMVGNGFGWGQLSHTLAWVLRVTDLRPVQAFCYMGHSEASGGDLYDSGTVLCEGGATISVQGVATLPGKNPVASKQIDNKVFGDEGFLMYSGDDQDPDSGSLLLRRHDGEAEELPGFLFENYEDAGLGPESLQAFVAACRARKAGSGDAAAMWNGCDAAVGSRVVALIDALYRSATSGLPADV